MTPKQIMDMDLNRRLVFAMEEINDGKRTRVGSLRKLESMLLVTRGEDGEAKTDRWRLSQNGEAKLRQIYARRSRLLLHISNLSPDQGVAMPTIRPPIDFDLPEHLGEDRFKSVYERVIRPWREIIRTSGGMTIVRRTMSGYRVELTSGSPKVLDDAQSSLESYAESISKLCEAMKERSS